LAVTRVVTEVEYCRKLNEVHNTVARMDAEVQNGYLGYIDALVDCDEKTVRRVMAKVKP